MERINISSLKCHTEAIIAVLGRARKKGAAQGRPQSFKIKTDCLEAQRSGYCERGKIVVSGPRRGVIKFA